MEELLKKFLLLGMGAFALTKEKMESLLEELSKAPEKMQINEFLSELLKKGQETRNELEQRIGEKLEKIIDQTRLATKDDIARLENKIDQIEKRLKGV